MANEEKIRQVANVLLDAVSLASTSDETPASVAATREMVRVVAQRIGDIEAITIAADASGRDVVEMAPLLKGTCAVILILVSELAGATGRDPVVVISTAREVLAELYPPP